jgi:hypothetical protein
MRRPIGCACIPSHSIAERNPEILDLGSASGMIDISMKIWKDRYSILWQSLRWNRRVVIAIHPGKDLKKKLWLAC